jgi:hypothetical protein
VTTAPEEKKGASAVARTRENPPSRKSADHYWHETPVLGYKNSDLLKETEDLQQELGDS